LIRDLTDAGLASTRVLAKLVAAGNQMNVPDVGLLSRLEYLEEVDFGNNPFECTCALNGFLDWTNTTTVTIIGNEDTSRFDDVLLHVYRSIDKLLSIETCHFLVELFESLTVVFQP
jgi:hypothetical protein